MQNAKVRNCIPFSILPFPFCLFHFALPLTATDRVGLLGGTFNPIHLGHLRAAVEVQEAFRLTRIILIPSAAPPHKSVEGAVSARDRLEMVRLSVTEVPGFEVSDVELERSGPSYSADTLDHFRAVLPCGARMFFILGMDAFLEIDTWDRHLELFDKAPFIVMGRPGAGNLESHEAKQVIGHFLYQKVSKQYAGFSKSGESFYFKHPEKMPIYTINVSALDISSTKIRKLIREGRSIRFLVPDATARFIYSKGLYKTP